MKEQANQHLAMDVHQATVGACVRDERGAFRMRATVPTDAGAILSLVRSAGTRVHVAFEEGTQAQWLHDLPDDRLRLGRYGRPHHDRALLVTDAHHHHRRLMDIQSHILNRLAWPPLLSCACCPETPR